MPVTAARAYTPLPLLSILNASTIRDSQGPFFSLCLLSTINIITATVICKRPHIR